MPLDQLKDCEILSAVRVTQSDPVRRNTRT
jgi:hypothetical protein